MKKTNQTKKTKDLESIPNFSIGLTPLEEEEKRKDKNQRNRGKRRGGTKINDESSDDNKQVKEKRLTQKSKGKKKEETDGNSEEQNIDQRLRHKLSIPKENMWIRLSRTDVLPLTEQDVHRVYGLPMSGEQINVDRCSEAAIKRLRKELGW
ncbi:hypothetical protein QL285_077044 [Trifolium repens]|nr:hypothetical protein QL285_077044 [Trifolium repens]